MRTNTLKLIVIVLMLAGNFSCQTMNISEGIIEPVPADYEVIAFFEEQLPAFSGTRRSECFFIDEIDKPYSEGKWTKHVLINSMDEFKKYFSCSSDLLPAIDFRFYTLIIGQQQMGGSGYSVDEQNIIVESKKIELNITVKCPEGSFAVICPLYYWGIYPKFQNKSISVNIIFQKGGLCL